MFTPVPSEVICDLEIYLRAIYEKNGGAAIHESRLIAFLSSRVPSERINAVIQQAELTHIISRVRGTFPPHYFPEA